MIYIYICIYIYTSSKRRRLKHRTKTEKNNKMHNQETKKHPAIKKQKETPRSSKGDTCMGDACTPGIAERGTFE